jgi:hypothetical protein
MRIHVLCQHSGAGLRGLTSALESLGHMTTHDVVAGPDVSDAAQLGHRLAARPLAADVLLASGWLAGLAAQIATRGVDTPVLQRLFTPGRAPDHDQGRLEGAIARGAARNLSLCGADVDRLVALGVRRASVRLVPHGVDTTLFRDEGPTWPRAGGRRVVARPDAMSAAELVSLLPSLPRSELVLLTTSMTRPAVTNAVSAAVAHHPVAHRVRLVDVSEVADDGVAPQGGMLPGLLRSADVVVTTGDDEPELDLALQAMACGVPVVARSAGAMSAVVADGVTGVLVGGVAPDALGDAARALLGDDLQLESFGFAAGDRARAAFGWPSVAAMVARVAGEVARGSHPDVVATGRAATEDHGGDDLWRDALNTS